MPSTQVLGFKTPFARDDRIVLPVLTETGEWMEFYATPATWRRIALALALQLDPAPPRPARPAVTITRAVAVRVDDQPLAAPARTAHPSS